MSIAQAAHDIEVAAGLPASRHAVFRARQAKLDRLIGEAEQLVMSGAARPPTGLIEGAGRALEQVHGRVPPWLTPTISPVALLDHLLVAEGRLRQKFYRAADLDLSDDG